MKAIIVHGGAGRVVKNIEETRKGIQIALFNGYKLLTSKNDAVMAVVEAVKTMEDNPIFNCGTGSTLNILGEAEMDASLMFISHIGEEPKFGAVAVIKSVKNPILIAQKILEETDHLLLAGEGALRFARKLGFEPYNPVTEERLKQLEEYKQKGDFGYFSKLSNYLRWETVGAVAIDDKGGIAVATSTGGILGKLPGRVGDTAIIGGGTYVSSFGGASATGHGEGIMKLLLTEYATNLMSEYPATYPFLGEHAPAFHGVYNPDLRWNTPLVAYFLPRLFHFHDSIGFQFCRRWVEGCLGSQTQILNPT